MIIASEAPRTAVTNDAFFRSLCENANDLIAAFDDEGVFGYVSAAIERLLGWRPDEVVGRGFSWFMHPDDLHRAIVQVASAEELRSTPSNSVFRLRHADGSWVPLDISASRATDGKSTWFVCFCRLAVAQEAASDVLIRLLNADSTRDVLAPVLHDVAWQDLGSQLAICWDDADGRQHVSTGLPESLCGLDNGGPWAEVRRTGQSVVRQDLLELDEDRRREASTHSRGGYWIEPVSTTDGETALIALWTQSGVDPRLHEYGMHKARRHVELVLQFTAQRRALDHAASHDPLTGLANRKALLEAMAADGGGALVYCDLDKFKPVNDELGHGAGDELLRLVAQRLRSCVRSGDVVARIGGDEFVVLSRNISAEETADVAQRMLEKLRQPFMIGQKAVEISASIGVALELDQVDEATLVAADQALYAAKSAGRDQVCWTSRSGQAASAVA